jgi:folate-binding protein YgfZ
MVTGDVKSLESGQGVYCFLTNAGGRILSDVVALDLSGERDEIDLLLPAGMAEEVGAHLSKFIVADRVEISSNADRVVLRLLGPKSLDALQERVQRGVLPEAPWRNQILSLEGAEVLAIAEDLGEVRGFTLLVNRDEAEALVRSLLRPDAAPGIVPCGSSAFDTVRIETGTLLFNRDFSIDHFPKETGLETAVSYTKGCYLGQEVVARIHYRGQVQRLARGLLFAGAPSPEGTIVRSGGRDIGAVTSSTLSPLLDSGIGLSILHRDSAEPGTNVELADGRAATVVDLPFEVPPD